MPTDQLRAALSDRYAIERELGAGGMATVYLARDLKHDREVALKVLRQDLSAVLGPERFLAEVRIAARLDHPHILTLIDSGNADGILYYVMPLVRGESLRARIDREKQLGIDDAFSITRQIASALDYAHKQGIVHRDIKPENILLHEGEAVLADFGIALAVREAGGNRLTETGLSLGTPQYMSPEQATGGRTLDARSDVYSLGAVLYEMLAGEPPVTGATAQAMIAKLLTEKPTRLCVIRDTVPEGMDRAVEKALAKVPADRFATAGDFVRALDIAGVSRHATPARARGGYKSLLVGGGVVAGALVGWLAWSGFGATRAPIVLRDRTQITTTGHVNIPAISSDGKTLAYATTSCTARGCSYGVELQDVGGSVSRHLFDGASALYRIDWSPDRRNLLLKASIDGKYGTYLLSVLGGAPRRVSPALASFWAGGDSLLIWRTGVPGDTSWILVAGLDAVPRDSIRVVGRVKWLDWAIPVPGSQWIVAGMRDAALASVVVVVDRSGREASRLMMAHPTIATAFASSSDALWLTERAGTSAQTILRYPFDARSGRIDPRPDTMYTGGFSAFGVTADGGSLVIDDGLAEYDLWATDLAGALRGSFPEQARIERSTSELSGSLSPDGTRILIGRYAAGKTPGGGKRYTIRRFDSRTEVPVAIPDRASFAWWLDSTRIAFMERLARGVFAPTRFSIVDAATGRTLSVLSPEDSAVWDYTHVGATGWAWVSGGGRAVSVQRDGEKAPTRYAMPDWYKYPTSVNASVNGDRLAVGGFSAPDEDSLGVSVVSLPDGRITQWFTTFGERASAWPLADGTLLIQVFESLGRITLYRARSPAHAERLGTIPRVVTGSLSVSDDARRAVVVTQDVRGDAFLSRVVRP